MRFLKKLLVSMFLFAAALLIACFVAWCITGEEPSALLACAATMFSAEALVSGYIKIKEKKMDAKLEQEMRQADNDEPPYM